MGTGVNVVVGIGVGVAIGVGDDVGMIVGSDLVVGVTGKVRVAVGDGVVVGAAVGSGVDVTVAVGSSVGLGSSEHPVSTMPMSITPITVIALNSDIFRYFQEVCKWRRRCTLSLIQKWARGPREENTAHEQWEHRTRLGVKARLEAQEPRTGDGGVGGIRQGGTATCGRSWESRSCRWWPSTRDSCFYFTRADREAA